GVEVVEVARGGVLGDGAGVGELLVPHRVAAAEVVGERRIECEVLVNCLGAWSPVLAAKIGIADASEPVRRQISLCDVHREDVAPGVELGSLGMIVDASGLYFHPEGPHVLACYAIPEGSPGFDFDYDADALVERET